MVSIQKQFTQYNHSPRSEQAKFIVVHDVGEVSTAKNNADYFSGGNRDASADFFVDSSNIIQIIDYHKDYSWAIGDGRGKYGKTNGNSLSIEMCLESNHMPSEATMSNTIDLIKYLMNELNIPLDNVVTHHMCTDKNCPGSFSANNWTKWYEFKARLSGQNVVPTPQPQPTQSPVEKGKAYVGSRALELQQKLNKIIRAGLLNVPLLVEDGDFGTNTYNTVVALQIKYLGVSQGDGLVGVKTWGVISNLINQPAPQPTAQPSVNQKVLAYQKAFNTFGLGSLSADGILGNLTLGSVQKLPMIQVGSNNAMVGWVQGIVGCGQDNVFGNITRSAVINYQSTHGLQADGIVGRITITYMLSH